MSPCTLVCIIKTIAETTICPFTAHFLFLMLTARNDPWTQMDLSVLSLWQQVSPRTPRGEKRRRALPGGKEPRFLFLDIGGVMGEENVVLPVLKYWVR